MKLLLLFLCLAVSAQAQSDPRLTSWYTAASGKYARLYSNDAAKSSGTASTTWSRGQGVQSLPTYCGISEVSYSASWVYIRTTGLGAHVMGPWYLDASRTQDFPNYPANTAVLYRIPRTPMVPTSTATLTGLGAIAYFVDGVSMFDNRDAFSYVNASGTDATPVNGLTGDGIWNRDAYTNESVTFDPANAHQAGKSYHYHANPPALRYLLGDHVDYNSSTKTYSEQISAPTKHSPILGWVADGLPIYGPYGYNSPLDATSGIRRMVSGYVKRDGSNGTSNLASTGRTTLPAWAINAQNRSAILASNQYGPAVNSTYVLGHYIEDYEYLGDLGKAQGTDFDLDYYNGRFCVTPDFPNGTYAYFVSIEADGTPKFPYNIGRWYYGSPTGGTQTSIAETVTTQFDGGPDLAEAMKQPAVSGTQVALSWSAVEGGTYQVEASSDLSAWATLTPTVTAGSDQGTSTDTLQASDSARFYRVKRTALAAYDSTGFNTTNTGGSAARGSTVTVTITLTAPPTIPPLTNAQGNAINVVSATLAGSITGTNLSRPTQSTVLATFVIPANASTGTQTITVVLQGPTVPTYNVSFAING